MVVLFNGRTDVYRNYFLEQVNHMIDEEVKKDSALFEEEEAELLLEEVEDCEDLAEITLERGSDGLSFDPYFEGEHPDLEGIANEGEDLFLADQLMTKWKMHHIDLYYAVLGTCIIDWFEAYFDDKEDILCSLLMDEENNLYNFETILRKYPNLRYMLFLNTFERYTNDFDKQEKTLQRNQILGEGYQDVYERYFPEWKTELYAHNCNIETLIKGGVHSKIALHFQNFVYEHAVLLEKVNFETLPSELAKEINRLADTSYPMDTILEALLEEYYFYTKGTSYLIDGDLHKVDRILLEKIENQEASFFLCQNPAWLYPFCEGYMKSVVSWYLSSRGEADLASYEELVGVEKSYQYMKKFPHPAAQENNK